MKRFLKGVGNFFLAIVMIVLMLAIPLVFFMYFSRFGVWLGHRILPSLLFIGGYVFALDVCLFLPLGIFKKTKSIAAFGLLISSWLYGITLFLWSLIFVYVVWGLFAVFIGLCFMGVGIAPVALVAIIVKGKWIFIGPFISYLVCIYGARCLGLYFLKQAEGE